MVKQGYLRAQKSRIRKKKKQELPHYETFLFDDYRIYVGKNNLQNDYVTWKLARKKDTWLHAKDLHGAHVILTLEQPNEAALRTAAMLAAWYSNGRYSSCLLYTSLPYVLHIAVIGYFAVFALLHYFWFADIPDNEVRISVFENDKGTYMAP